MVVIASYLSLRFQARFRSEAGLARVTRRRHIRNAKRIERAICQLQGLFIKVGQLISIMTNFLPAEFREQLEGLQDNVPPRPYPDIERRIKEEFDGKGPREIYAQFQTSPVASASIGQVHVAHLKNGQRVAVKVQYPDIERIVKSDLKTLRRIFRIVGHFVAYEGLDDVYSEIRAMILEELDFRAEADNVARIAANFEDRTDVAFPTVVQELSTARVLTTHFETGTKISDVSGIKAQGLDQKRIAKQIVELYCQQIFTDGEYHADPHPGNLLVRKNTGGELCIVFLDFGAVAQVSPGLRRGIIELIQGGFTRDTPRIVKALKQMGVVARGADEKTFDKIVEYFHDRFQEEIALDSFNLKDIKFDPEKSLENLADLRKLDVSLRELTAQFHIPKELILLERTLLLLMGLCTELDPTMNPMAIVRPYLERFVLGDDADWSSFVVDTTKDMVMSVTALPAEARKFIKSAQAGDLSVRFHNVDRATRLVYRLGHQVIYVALGIAGATIALVLEGRGDYQRAEWGWWTARVCGVLLVWSWWSTRGWLKKR